MKKQCKPWLMIASTIFVVLNLLCYFSIRSMWSGIILYTGQPVPYICLAILTLFALSGVLGILNKKYYLIHTVLLMIAGLFFFCVDAYIISQTTEAYWCFIREFLYGALYLAVVGLLFYLIVYFHRTKETGKRWIPSVILVVIFLAGIVWRFDLVPNKITSIPVVYAVEDTYQIVFTSRAKGTAWVEVNGKEYNDTYAGYRQSESKVHKITVPMEELDAAGEYTIYTKSMLLRGPYCSLQGTTLSKTCRWRGVDAEDGLNYYVISDAHHADNGPLGAATYYGDSLDFLVNCGDNVNWIDRTADLTEALRLCGNITNGEIPVVYARGNHETKGVLADELYQYVGSVNQKFYYTFRLNNVWGIVLDIGEDHGDDYIEYYGAAKFDDYRAEQTEFLDTVLANAETEFDAPGVDYRIAVCHIPLTIKYNKDHAGAYKDEWLLRLNQMKLTMLYGGHVHELFYIDPSFEAGSKLTQCMEYSGKESGNSSRIMCDADFPAILASRKSEGQQLTFKEEVFDRHFIGLAVSSDGEQTVMQYTNEKHEIVGNIVSPWFSDITYGDRIVVENIK